MAEITLLFLTLSFVAITYVAWHVVASLWLKPKKLERFLRNQGFSGNPYCPISGDLPEINQMSQSALSNPMPMLSHDLVSRLAPSTLQTVKKYGENSYVWNGNNTRVNVMKPELIREIFGKHDVFRKQPLGKPSSFGLVLRDGEDWVRVKRIINPAFHMEKLKNMLPVMNVSVEAMLGKWEEMIAGKEEVEMDVFSSLSSMAGDVITRTSFGSCYEDGKKLFQLENENLYLKFQAMQSLYYHLPGWSYVPTKTHREIKSKIKQIEVLVKSFVEDRKRAIKEGESKNDLLSIMLESNEKDIEEKGVGLTSEEIIAECRLFLLAGKDTTSSLLTWTLVLLTQHQDWQTQARDEVLQHFGKHRVPDFEGLNSLKIVNMILHETLRFYPPVPGLNRVIGQDTKLKDFELLQDMEVNIPTILVHRNTDIWGSDANEFNPSRFSKGVSSAAVAPGSGSFLPFGGGPRICIGQNFALMEAKLALARILQRFSFQLSPSYVHAPIPVVGLVPKYGAPLILRKI